MFHDFLIPSSQTITTTPTLKMPIPYYLQDLPITPDPNDKSTRVEQRGTLKEIKRLTKRTTFFESPQGSSGKMPAKFSKDACELFRTIQRKSKKPPVQWISQLQLTQNRCTLIKHQTQPAVRSDRA